MKSGVLSCRLSHAYRHLRQRLRFNIQKRDRAVVFHARHRDHITAIGAEVQLILSAHSRCIVNSFPLHEYFLLGLDVWLFRIMKLPHDAHSLKILTLKSSQSLTVTVHINYARLHIAYIGPIVQYLQVRINHDCNSYTENVLHLQHHIRPIFRQQI